MKSNKTLNTWAFSGLVAAILLTACGGGGGGGGSTPSTPSTPTTVTGGTAADVSFSIAYVAANAPVSASVKVSNAGSADLSGVWVVVSSVQTVDTSTDGSGSTTMKDTVLYNSSEDAQSTQAIAKGGNVSFGLKNVNFGLASSDTGSSASASSCSSTSDLSLGQVLLEVFSQDGKLTEAVLPVCSLQGGQTYAVSVGSSS